jgi:hypothetical protein
MPMTDVHFESSTLWQQTLGAAREECERLRRSYLATRDNATVLLNELSHSMPHFTVHDITHVDALWETASMLCGSTVALTPAEGYVLGCAFVLHDAAMGAASYQEPIESAIGVSRWHDLLSSFIVSETGNWPTAEELASPDEEITKACAVHAIRELHAARAQELVDQSWTTSTGNELYLIEDVQLRESYGPLIGDLAASHWWSVDQLEGYFRRGKGSLPWQPAGWVVDPLKLACILRLADATQVDGRRAPTFLYALRQPEGNAQNHWRFQEHVARPHLDGDRVTFTAWRPFDAHDADAWWLALDYLRKVDDELKKVDALLHDVNRPRFEGRAVAGVDSPERFVELFPVRGWRPVDARIAVTDVPRLVETLGGEQLYGNEPEIAVRELLQNAQDAVVARKSLDPGLTDDEIVVTLTESNDTWTLEIIDRGAGMDEEILTTALLDFGRTGWTSDAIRNKFVGLVDGGFRPKGRFGIGFFAVFMLGDNIEIVTRRFDSSPGDARRLKFRGVRARPILTPISADERTPIGTRVRAELKLSPYDTKGIFANTTDYTLSELIQRLCPEHSVSIRSSEPSRSTMVSFPPSALQSASTSKVFDLLYPPLDSSGPAGDMQRQQFRDTFTRRATELKDSNGNRIGLAAFGLDLYSPRPVRIEGIILVDGFLSDQHQFFAGYIEGLPSRAARDKVEIAADRNVLSQWINSQEARLRELHLFTPSMQVEMAYLLYRANHTLALDHIVAATAEGLMRTADVRSWASAHSAITMTVDWPIQLLTRPLSLVHHAFDAPIQLPDGWICAAASDGYSRFQEVLETAADESYEYARLDQTNTWQKKWWQISDHIRGFVLKLICEAWECEIGEILEPVEKRGWSDMADLGYEQIGQVPVYRLNRPVRRTSL